MEFRASADTPRAEEIQTLVKVMSGALDQAAEDLGVRAGTTHVVLADDFAAEVEATNREIAAPNGQTSGVPFTVERLGGAVVGKTPSGAGQT
jgi:hypothetical protein